MGTNNHKDTNGNLSKGPTAKIFSELCSYVLRPASETKQGQEELAALGPDLYHGASGIGLFFAAYYRATNDPNARSVALETMNVARRGMEKLRPATIPIGGMVGLGSFIYALTTASDWLNAPELFEAASEVVSMITPELINADNVLDVMTGCAGTLLALLSFAHVARARESKAGSAADLAIACGRHLLKSRTAHDKFRVWPCAKGAPCPGFAHGATGISYALARLFELTNDDEFREAALEGFAFERTLYVPEQQGWRDLNSNQIMERDSWCYGAPGIALARLGCLKSMDGPAFRRDLEEALQLTLALPETENDQLCCGNFGRIDVVHTAGYVLRRLQLSERALDLTKRTIQRSQVEGFRFVMPSHGDFNGHSRGQGQRFNPSLFLGLAGIGYTLLRLENPELFPSVLLLETEG